MSEPKEYTLEGVGLPRANANGLFLAAIIIITVSSVMAFSCNKKEKQRSTSIDSAAQPLTGNEWFVGKAQGIELPKAPPPPEPEVEPFPEPVMYRQPSAPKAPPQAPEKRLGGKIIAASTPLSMQAAPAPNHLQANANEVAPYHAPTVRPEYYLSRDVEAPLSDFEIKAGTSIPAQLDIAVNSDLGGAAVGHVTRTIYDTVTGTFPLIPPGTKLYGNIDPNITFGQTRVDIIWERLIFPNGASLVVQNMRAADRAGQTGLHHTVNHHFDRLFGGAVLLSAISSGVQLSQPQRNTGFNSSPTIGETLAGALGQNLGQVSSEFIRRQMNVRPTITIPTGEHFTVIVNKDMVFPAPYGEWE